MQPKAVQLGSIEFNSGQSAMPPTKFSWMNKDKVVPAKQESSNCHLEIVSLGLGESSPGSSSAARNF